MSKQGIWDYKVDSYSNCVSVLRFQSVFCQLHIPINNEGKWLKYSPSTTYNVSKTTNPHFSQLVNNAPKLQRPSIDAGLLSLFHSLSANFFNVLALNNY